MEQYDHINDPDLNRTSDKVGLVLGVLLVLALAVTLVVGNL